MKETQEKPTGLPENAFRPLKPGEKYEPLMSPGKTYPEVNFWSVTWGLVMAVIFSAAAAYLGLKVGQVFEAAIPIAIIAVGISSATKRKGALGENVMIQSIGACSGVIVRVPSLPCRPLHPAGKISGNDGQLHADVHQLLAGWCAGHPVPDSLP